MAPVDNNRPAAPAVKPAEPPKPDGIQGLQKRDPVVELIGKKDPAELRALLQNRDTFTLNRAQPINLDGFQGAIGGDLDKLLSKLPYPTTSGDDRTSEEAQTDSDALLGGPVLTGTENPDTHTTVTRNPADANDPRDVDPASDRHQCAQAQVDANAVLEQKELETLSPEDRAKYMQVKEAAMAAGDPVAELALQQMLFKGQLPGAQDLRGEGTLLDQLAKIADPKTPLAKGVDRGQLLTDVIQECATPSCVAQHGKGTCTVTAVSIDLIRRNPAEYARLVAGLASPEGTVVMGDGKTVATREEGSITDGVGRTMSQRLLEPALMEIANGADEDYDEGKDADIEKDGTQTASGEWAPELDRVMNALYGPGQDKGITTWDQKSKDKAWDIINNQLDAGRSVPVAMQYGTGSHKVLVTGTETINGEEYVKFINPWGQEEQMKKADFLKCLEDVNYDPTTQPSRFDRLPKELPRISATELLRQSMRLAA